MDTSWDKVGKKTGVNQPSYSSPAQTAKYNIWVNYNDLTATSLE